jgi:predicted amidohydrolase YtcJ
MSAPIQPSRIADLVIYNGKIATQDDKRSFVTALAIAKGEIVASGNDHDMMQWANESTRRIDLKGKPSRLISNLRNVQSIR